MFREPVRYSNRLLTVSFRLVRMFRDLPILTNRLPSWPNRRPSPSNRLSSLSNCLPACRS